MIDGAMIPAAYNAVNMMPAMTDPSRPTYRYGYDANNMPVSPAD